MASTRGVKQRIKAAKNITQITKAMEMVAAAKMRRSQNKALSSRPYSTKLLSILSQMSTQINKNLHPFLRHNKNATNNILLIVVSSDRGLCGALNTNLFRGIEEFMEQISAERYTMPLSYEYITVGRKAREFILKSGKALHAEFTNFPERPTFSDTLPISKLAIEGFKTCRFREAYIVYMDFVSTIKQIVKVDRLLPIVKKDISDISKEQPQIEPGHFIPRYLFEPNSEEVLNWLLPYFIETQIFQKILESQASEHSARMVTMRNASENAKEVVAELSLMYNRQRQQNITNQIAEIVTSTMALQ